MDERIVGYMRGAVLRGQSRQDTFDKLTGIGVSYKEIMEDFKESSDKREPEAHAPKPEEAQKTAAKENRMGRLEAALAAVIIIAAVILLLWR